MKAIQTMKISRDAAAIGAALTGVAVIWSAVYYRLEDMFGTGWAIFGSVFVVLAVLSLIDFGFRQYLPYGLNLIFSGKWLADWRATTFVALLMLVCGAQAAISISVSWSGRQDMVEATVPEPELQDLATAKLQLDKSTSKKVQAVEREIQSIERDIRKAEQEVLRTHAVSAQRVRTGTDTKHSWHAKNLKKAKEKATRDLRAQLLPLRERKMALLEKDEQLSEQALAQVQELNASKMQFYNTRKNRNQAFIGYFGVGCTILMIVFSAMLELANTAQRAMERWDSEQDSQYWKVPGALSLRRAASTTPPSAPAPRGIPEPVSMGDTRARETEYLDHKLRELERQVADNNRQVTDNTDRQVKNETDSISADSSEPLSDKKDSLTDRKPSKVSAHSSRSGAPSCAMGRALRLQGQVNVERMSSGG